MNEENVKKPFLVAEVDQELDVFDEDSQKWYIAKVVDKKDENHQLFVHYIGWNAVHDEWIPNVPARCAPAFTKVKKRANKKNGTKKEHKSRESSPSVDTRMYSPKPVPQEYSELIAACQADNLCRVASLLPRDSSIKEFRSLCPSDTCHPLLHATHYGSVTVVEYLCSIGFNPLQRGTVHPYTGDSLTVDDCKNVSPLALARVMSTHITRRSKKRERWNAIRDILNTAVALNPQFEAEAQAASGSTSPVMLMGGTPHTPTSARSARSRRSALSAGSGDSKDPSNRPTASKRRGAKRKLSAALKKQRMDEESVADSESERQDLFTTPHTSTSIDAAPSHVQSPQTPQMQTSQPKTSAQHVPHQHTHAPQPNNDTAAQPAASVQSSSLPEMSYTAHALSSDATPTLQSAKPPVTDASHTLAHLADVAAAVTPPAIASAAEAPPAAVTVKKEDTPTVHETAVPLSPSVAAAVAPSVTSVTAQQSPADVAPALSSSGTATHTQTGPPTPLVSPQTAEPTAPSSSQQQTQHTYDTAQAVSSASMPSEPLPSAADSPTVSSAANNADRSGGTDNSAIAELSAAAEAAIAVNEAEAEAAAALVESAATAPQSVEGPSGAHSSTEQSQTPEGTSTTTRASDSRAIESVSGDGSATVTTEVDRLGAAASLMAAVEAEYAALPHSSTHTAEDAPAGAPSSAPTTPHTPIAEATESGTVSAAVTEMTTSPRLSIRVQKEPSPAGEHQQHSEPNEPNEEEGDASAAVGSSSSSSSAQQVEESSKAKAGKGKKKGRTMSVSTATGSGSKQRTPPTSSRRARRTPRASYAEDDDDDVPTRKRARSRGHASSDSEESIHEADDDDDDEYTEGYKPARGRGEARRRRSDSRVGRDFSFDRGTTSDEEERYAVDSITLWDAPIVKLLVHTSDVKVQSQFEVEAVPTEDDEEGLQWHPLHATVALQCSGNVWQLLCAVSACILDVCTMYCTVEQLQAQLQDVMHRFVGIATREEAERALEDEIVRARRFVACDWHHTPDTPFMSRDGGEVLSVTHRTRDALRAVEALLCLDMSSPVEGAPDVTAAQSAARSGRRPFASINAQTPLNAAMKLRNSSDLQPPVPTALPLPLLANVTTRTSEVVYSTVYDLCQTYRASPAQLFQPRTRRNIRRASTPRVEIPLAKDIDRSQSWFKRVSEGQRVLASLLINARDAAVHCVNTVIAQTCATALPVHTLSGISSSATAMCLVGIPQDIILNVPQDMPRTVYTGLTDIVMKMKPLTRHPKRQRRPSQEECNDIHSAIEAAPLTAKERLLANTRARSGSEVYALSDRCLSVVWCDTLPPSVQPPPKYMKAIPHTPLRKLAHAIVLYVMQSTRVCVGRARARPGDAVCVCMRLPFELSQSLYTADTGAQCYTQGSLDLLLPIPAAAIDDNNERWTHAKVYTEGHKLRAQDRAELTALVTHSGVCGCVTVEQSAAIALCCDFIAQALSYVECVCINGERVMCVCTPEDVEFTVCEALDQYCIVTLRVQ